MYTENNFEIHWKDGTRTYKKNNKIMTTQILRKPEYQELSSELYELTCDFISEQLLEMLYDKDLIKETDDAAMEIFNKTLKQYYNTHLTKTW